MTSGRDIEINFGGILKFVICTYFLAFFACGLSRHWGFMSSLNDLGHFDQAVWGTLQGDILLNSDLFNTAISRLGIHFDPILFFFVPLYAIWAEVTWFTLAQAVAISVSAWPIFLLAKEVTRSEGIGFALALAYMLNPYILNAAAWDFHPVALAVPFIAWGMLAIERKNFKFLLVCSFFILLCKEHFGILVAGFGLLWWLRNRSARKSALLIMLGCLHFLLVLKVIMPLFSPTGEHLMISQDMGHLSRYGWLGNSVGEILGNLFSDPLSVYETAMVEFQGSRYLFLLFLLFLWMPLLGLEFIIPGLADLGANLLSATHLPKSVFSYHSVTFLPVLACAAVYGVKRFCRSSLKFMRIMATAILSVNVALGYSFAPFPLPLAANIWGPKQFINLPDPEVEKIRSMIPPGASVSAQANLGAHFSRRKEIFLYPHKVGQADFLILMLENPTRNMYSESLEPDEIFLQHFQASPDEYLSSIRQILRRGQYSVVYLNPPWLVFSKEILDHSPNMDIESVLRKLELEWMRGKNSGQSNVRP